MEQKSTRHISKIILDEATILRATPDVEHDRAVAIFDLIEENHFHPTGHDNGPYVLQLSLANNKLVFNIKLEDNSDVATHILSLTPLRRVVRDYFLICQHYYEAIKSATPSQIETIDMGRRGLHNDGTRILQERLKEKIQCDFDTARRLFTLVCALDAFDG